MEKTIKFSSIEKSVDARGIISIHIDKETVLKMSIADVIALSIDTLKSLSHKMGIPKDVLEQINETKKEIKPIKNTKPKLNEDSLSNYLKTLFGKTRKEKIIPIEDLPVTIKPQQIVPLIKKCGFKAKKMWGKNFVIVWKELE